MSYENDELLNTNNQETFALLKTKTKTYMTTDDYNFK
jgi:hypothetical protein